MILAPLEVEHIEAFELVSDSGIARAMRECMDQGTAYAVLDRGEVLAAGGAVEIWHGIAEAWALVAPDFDSRPRTVPFLRSFRGVVAAGIGTAASRLGVHRLQSVVPADQPGLRRWARHVGFTEEGVMRAYGSDGSDFVRIAKIGAQCLPTVLH